MRILRIVYDWPPPWGGLAPAPYELSFSQAKLGHDIDVFCGRWPRAGKIEKIPGISLHPFIREPLAGTLNVTISFALFFYYLAWRRKNEVDVIHSHGHFAIWIYAYRVFLKRFFPNAKELKTPLVAHFHNTVKGRWEKLLKDKKPIKPVSKYFAWPLAMKSDKWAISAADACVFVSVDLRQEAIVYYNADSEKCHVVETGVNIELFTPIGSEELVKTKQELELKAEDKVILNSGAMVERKNIHLIVEALHYLPKQYKLLLVGPSPDEEYESRIQDIIIKHDLQERIVRVGYTPYPQIQIAHQVSDLFVLPSQFEGFPKVVIQSLACGVPALVSGFKAKEKIDGLTYITELSAQNIAKQIQEVVEKKENVNLGLVRGKYSWDQMAKKVDEIYGKVIN